MSFFEKFTETGFEQNISLRNSIKAKITMLFENRADLYYSYNFKKKEIVPIHRFARIDINSPNYIPYLKKCLLAIEPRIDDVEITILNVHFKVFLEIVCKCNGGLLNFSIKAK